MIVNTALDREKKNHYDLTLICTDNGEPPLASEQKLVIRITDVNDNSPKFLNSHYTFSLRENNSPPEIIGTVKAADEDLEENGNGKVKYILENTDGNFAIDENKGTLMSVSRFDREFKDTYELLIIAFDSGKPISLSSRVNVTVHIEDRNDEMPTFSKETYNFLVRENLPASSPLGLIEATDRDATDSENSQITYSLLGTRDFAVDSLKGELRTTRKLDRESMPEHQFQACATDNGHPAQQGCCRVHVKVLYATLFSFYYTCTLFYSI